MYSWRFLYLTESWLHLCGTQIHAEMKMEHAKDNKQQQHTKKQNVQEMAWKWDNCTCFISALNFLFENTEMMPFIFKSEHMISSLKFTEMSN